MHWESALDNILTTSVASVSPALIPMLYFHIIVKLEEQ